MSPSEFWAAIDLMGGNVVSLQQGDPNKSTIWSNAPVEVAKRWEHARATGLHIVDLDAVLGRGENHEIIQSILRESQIPIQIGGGIRTSSDIENWLDRKVARVVIGTLAYTDPSKLREVLRTFGSKKVVVAADYKHGTIVTNGWRKGEREEILDSIRRLETAGVETVLVTSVDLDGTARGPDLLTLKNVRAATSMKVLASGGIRSVHDVLELQKIGLHGVVAGRAIYEGTLNMKELNARG
jgi:phosphoribosylformimino-5-aminoimidazole carboxamide ribotide isomerase